MSLTKYDFREGNTLSTFRLTVLDKNTKEVVPLAASFTATIWFKIDENPSVTKAMTVLTGADDGKVEYQFITGELIEGTMTIIVTIVETGSGKDASTVNDIIKKVGPPTGA